MSLSNNYNPVEQVTPTTAVGSATPSIPLLTTSSWVKLLSAFITYVTQAATTPVLTFKIVDSKGNVLWQQVATVLAAASTSTLQLGSGVTNVSAAAAQTLALPNDMVIPPGGQLLLTATAANAADTYAANINYGN